MSILFFFRDKCSCEASSDWQPLIGESKIKLVSLVCLKCCPLQEWWISCHWRMADSQDSSDAPEKREREGKEGRGKGLIKVQGFKGGREGKWILLQNRHCTYLCLHWCSMNNIAMLVLLLLLNIFPTFLPSRCRRRQLEKKKTLLQRPGSFSRNWQRWDRPLRLKSRTPKGNLIGNRKSKKKKKKKLTNRYLEMKL